MLSRRLDFGKPKLRPYIHLYRRCNQCHLSMERATTKFSKRLRYDMTVLLSATQGIVKTLRCTMSPDSLLSVAETMKYTIDLELIIRVASV